MEIGARLKEAREANNISLDSLQEITKIQKRYLLAIEEGNFHILPGKFYARAFIKEYANAVGLDPNDLLEEYKEEIPKTEEEDSDIQYTRIQRSRKENNGDKSPAIFSIIPTVIVVLLIIGIFFVAWYLIKETMSEDGSSPQEEPSDSIIINNPDDNNQPDNGNQDEGTDEETEGTEESNSDESVDQAEEEETEPEFTVVEEGTGASPESTIDFHNAGDEIKVTLESDGNTWLEIRDGDNQATYNATFGEKDSPKEIDMSGTDKIYFNIGNAPDLKISINGVELEYPADANKYVHQRIWININQETE